MANFDFFVHMLISPEGPVLPEDEMVLEQMLVFFGQDITTKCNTKTEKVDCDFTKKDDSTSNAVLRPFGNDFPLWSKGESYESFEFRPQEGACEIPVPK